MCTIHYILIVTTGLLALSSTGAWLFFRAKRKPGTDDRAWNCIDLPSPDTPHAFPARCRARLQTARLNAPAVLAMASLLLTAVAGVSAWAC